MILFKHSKDLQSYLKNIKSKKTSIGFIPTMGALHAGHISLIKASRLKAGLTVCSIFVNPVQFNNSEDFKKYPSTIEKDILLLEKNGCDILFMPPENEIYPDAASRNKHVNLGNLENILEGKYRPGHFQGVCNVVEKLFNIVQPDIVFIGQKDFQQCLVIKKLVHIMHRKIKIEICPILREASGLAMSSRNVRLTSKEKQTASQLHKALKTIQRKLEKNNFLQLKSKAISKLNSYGFKVDYLELALRKDLTLTEQAKAKGNYIILIAAFLNDVRLIDNIAVTI